MISLVFFGSSSYSLIILKKIIESVEFDLKLVVTKTDKTFGRDQKITPNPVAQYALNHHLPLLQIENFNKNCKLKIKNCQASLGLCVAFGPPFFDQELIDIFPQKIVNIHPSPLPKYRGATPGPWQIINGESQSGVTFFQIDLLPDHGPIIKILPFSISTTDTADSFYQKAFNLAAENLFSVLDQYISDPSLSIQDHTQKSYFKKFTKDTAKIDWSQNSINIDRFVRGLNPWPIAWTFTANSNQDIFKMKIFSYDLNNNEPKIVQIEGKKITPWSEIKKYYSIIDKN